VVLPVVIPASMAPHEALNDNDTYRVVWQVLQALRSHDDRFDAMINKLELTGADPRKMEVIAVTDKVVRRSAKRDEKGDAKRAARGGRCGEIDDGDRELGGLEFARGECFEGGRDGAVDEGLERGGLGAGEGREGEEGEKEKGAALHRAAGRRKRGRSSIGGTACRRSSAAAASLPSTR
jgi:hypothetical protein